MFVITGTFPLDNQLEYKSYWTGTTFGCLYMAEKYISREEAQADIKNVEFGVWMLNQYKMEVEEITSPV
jgi:hypothetical protein